ncbi:MAG TPA: pyridoxal-dependent decarboxylase [Acidimicrobiales bacterium]|mgnify:CR=1 FL=1|nr:pyridoxal-dependent decarboxylase [Acidimicrobiales bacterium]
MTDHQPTAATTFHMTPDEFRRRGYEVVDWLARYYEEVERYPVLAQVGPGDVRAALPTAPPEHPEAFDDVMADLERVILPGVTHWQSPNFFAYFPANSSGPSVLGDLLSSGLGVQGMLWATSPACTELETVVLDWVVDLLGLPDRFRSDGPGGGRDGGPGGGVIQDSASSATLCAVVAARHRAAPDGDLTGLVAYTSEQAHSSVEKGVRVAGLPAAALRTVAVDETFAMRPDALGAAIEADLAAGLRPFFVCATVGTTSSTALDPVPAIADVCERHGLWLHVDAAMSGSAAVVPELRFVNEGLDRVDSYCFDPHKWLFTNFDCDCFYVADRTHLIGALSVLPEYLRNAASEAGAVVDYRDWHVPLGRRFRALKLWLVIRHYGAEGLRHHVRRHVELTRELVGWIEADDRFELAAPVPLNLVCFRHVGGDETNQRILDECNASGALHLTHTRLADRLTLRLCVGQTHTERRHVEAAWARITELA